MEWHLKNLPKSTLFQGLCWIAFFVVMAAALLESILDDVFWRKGQAKISTCLSHTKQIGFAALQYAQDYDDMLPDSAPKVSLPHGLPAPMVALTVADGTRDWPTLLTPYTRNTNPFYCPLDATSPASGLRALLQGQPNRLSSYTLNGWTAFGLNQSQIRNPALFVLFAERNTTRLDPHSSYLFSWWKWQPKGSGFAWPPSAEPIPTAQAARDLARTRHSGYSAYGFADGHAKVFRFPHIWPLAKPTAFWPESQ